MAPVDQARPIGTAGSPVTVWTNHFAVDRIPTTAYYQYEAFNPEVKNARRRTEIFNKLQTITAISTFRGRSVYDGRFTSFAPGKLELSNGSLFSVDMKHDNAPPSPRNVYSLAFRPVGNTAVSFGELNSLVSGQAVPGPKTDSAIKLLNLLIRADASLRHVTIGRAYFPDGSQTRSLDGGLEFWKGFFASVRPTIGRILVNIDIANAAMVERGSLLNVAMKFFETRDLSACNLSGNDPRLVQLKYFLKNIVVKVQPDGRKKVIRNLIANAASQTFTNNEGRVVTVEQHYHEVHNIRLRQPRAFGLVFPGHEPDSVVVIPGEVCEIISGQHYKRKLSQKQTANMVRFATGRPEERLAFITGRADASALGGPYQSLTLSLPTSTFMTTAGMSVSQNPVLINARTLAAPPLQTGQNATILSQGGAWNFTKSKALTPKNLSQWFLANFDPSCSAPYLRDIANALMQSMKKIGMTVEPPIIFNGDRKNIDTSLKGAGQDAMRKQKAQGISDLVHPQLYVVVLQSADPETRRKVKFWGNITQGVLTQCIKSDKPRDRRGGISDQYTTNVALKINSRLGGTNTIPQSLALRGLGKEPYMLIGLDVSHPAAGVANQPSFVGMVFSTDLNAIRYQAWCGVQPPRVESITDLDKMIGSALKAFYRATKTPERDGILPFNIIVYRDGISEGEIDAVTEVEIGAIEGACAAAWRSFPTRLPRPKLTFMSTVKRHHTRFFPNAPNQGDRSGNCHPGLVVDNGLQNPSKLDFFLQSHGGLLGTSRPAHYTVLRDDIFGNDVDRLQELSFALCHCYASATRSVSIPAPVYYADRVCSQAEFRLEHIKLDSSSTSSRETWAVDMNMWEKAFQPIHPDLQTRMYFL